MNTALWQPEFGRVEAPYWTRKPVIVVGTGPSLKGFEFWRLQGKGHVLAVKQAWIDLPFADACFGLDLPWMLWAKDDLERLAKRMPLYLAVPDQVIMHEPVKGAIYLRRERRCEMLASDPSTIESGGNSGFGALNLAWLKKARHVVLFGFDYQGVHFDPERYSPRPVNATHNAAYLPRWAKNFNTTLTQLNAAGVSVVNASPDSTVDAFPRVTHEQAFDYLDRLGA